MNEENIKKKKKTIGKGKTNKRKPKIARKNSRVKTKRMTPVSS